MNSNVQKNAPLLVVISGPSGVGKDAVIAKLRETHPEIFFAVTATTRPIRAGEIEGRDYFFITPSRFAQLLALGEFLEHAEVYGRQYGVPKDPLRNALAEGHDAIVKVDVQGAMTIQTLAPGAFLVFLAAPSLEELERRLTSRKTDSPGQLAIRIQTARDEMEQSKSFDAVIINETGALIQTVEAIVEAIQNQRADTSRRPVLL
jgi:guanylate kinase